MKTNEQYLKTENRGKNVQKLWWASKARTTVSGRRKKVVCESEI